MMFLLMLYWIPRESISIGEKMIHKIFLSVFHKYFFGQENPRRFLTAFFHSNPTFPWNFCGTGDTENGDVTHA